ncbi:MAG: dTDP-4-dehydrorhamnose 3,5-epimerase [Chloroherpetonaceae bacterium]|nr:dTDP-4-dehydrorhamnose 3,5-epimerase [Chthonomonadaceae bacterium]MDW8208277.1 dTDP-4-dehydrorhamnose 3,5-epimerase [Chloroherpetonaceae bacterium]
MRFIETELKGAFLIEIEPREDARGFFARAWCEEEFRAHGLCPEIRQCNISFNRYRGTLRGMHYQAAPYGEVKLVRCTMGAVYDVIIDLRPESPTYCRWIGVELSQENRRMLYIPEGFAHGFQTLQDNTELFYQMSEFFHPEAACGVRWDDPVFGIVWPPVERRILSERDQQFPDFRP